ncbi:SRPBCC family protein [Streptomyces sp. NPDC057740]|uniref:aromatase/cyclase n=1 Tax=Streptomyces sp. NPDC057740 TaxID=3346234 RepID=UPI003679CCFD
MSRPDEHRAEHQLEHRVVHTLRTPAPARRLYELVARAEHWPAVFEPSVHVRILERDRGTERFRIWASVAGQVKTWTSRRTLDPDALRVTFRQERTQPPIASMGGSWEFRADGDGTEIVLTHDFAAVDEDALPGLRAALDTNSGKELAALARLAERPHPVEELLFTFEDTLQVPSGDDAYAFIERSDLWPDRLPHVGKVTLTEEAADGRSPVVQDMTMETVTADGSAHTTRSIRLCFPGEAIVYKQLVPPALLTGHSGAWLFDKDTVTARHTVAIDPTRIEEVLGEGTTVADARAYLRDALGANSRATLSHAAGAAADAGPTS